MNSFFIELRKRNKLLFAFGVFLILDAFFCLGFAVIEHKSILGANAFLKPFKYGFVSGLISWFFGWILVHLSSKKTKFFTSWIHVLAIFAINFIVILQAFRGVPSHFNTSSPFNEMLNTTLLGSYILYTLLITWITTSFLIQKKMPTSQHYAWGIRMSLLVYLLFLFDGFYMMVIKSHLVSGQDSEKGLYFLNWSTKHGDLRIIHYIGILALPSISLASYYVFKKKKQIIFFAISYFITTIRKFLLE